MMEIPKQNHAGEYSVIVVIRNDMVGVVFAQFEKGGLAHFKKLVVGVGFDVVGGNVVVLGVEEHKGNQQNPEKAKGVGDEVGEECESSHFQKALLSGLDLSME